MSARVMGTPSEFLSRIPENELCKKQVCRVICQSSGRSERCLMSSDSQISLLERKGDGEIRALVEWDDGSSGR